MEHLAEKLKKVKERDNYINQYLDNFYFLLAGLALGILGGMFGNFLDRVLVPFGILYSIVLSVAFISTFYYFLNSATKNAKLLMDQNFKELDEIKKELEALKNVTTQISENSHKMIVDTNPEPVEPLLN